MIERFGNNVFGFLGNFYRSNVGQVRIGWLSCKLSNDSSKLNYCNLNLNGINPDSVANLKPS